MSQENGIAFSQTIKPLALAPIAGLVILTGFTLRNSGMHGLTLAPFLALRIAPFCYGAAVLFVVPILAIWPAMRMPTYSVAAIWGIFSGGAAILLLMWVLRQSARINWETVWAMVPFSAARAVSGLFYAYLMRRRRHGNPPDLEEVPSGHLT
jgi:hypothetical protein